MGCSGPPDDHYQGRCEMCGRYVDDCECPECPRCGAIGDPECYAEHGLVEADEQRKSRAKLLVVPDPEPNFIVPDEAFWPDARPPDGERMP